MLNTTCHADFIDDVAIVDELLKAQAPDAKRVADILRKARELKGLDAAEIAALMHANAPSQIEELFDTARDVKDAIYGERLVVFAPLYISNHCKNECAYCAFRVKNTHVARKKLTMPEIAAETRALVDQGHKRVLLVTGEAYGTDGFDYVINAIDAVYGAKTDKGEIRRINVNVAPLEVAQFEQLKVAKIGTYQIFQETYDRTTYARMHTAGPKRDYDYRLTAPDRAMQAGIDDLGIGVLFGLFNWKFEMLAMMQHIRHLEERFGVGPHTISVPRLEPADGSTISAAPPHAVSDLDFRRIVAILRLAVPYTGIIMSTRETAAMRRETFSLGVSQISAGSRTDPGGYTDHGKGVAEQFSLGDHRDLDEVIRDVAQMGYIPSFCTGCYRLGRTGQDFMDMAKPGLIKKFCQPNAISTFKEYLMDYASPETREVGDALITKLVDRMPKALRERSNNLLNKVTDGEHDVYV